MTDLALNSIGNREGTQTVTVDTMFNGTAKSWVNLNGTGTPAATDSFNFSSVTDNGTGDYTINFTNTFANATYNPTGAGGWQQSNSSSSGVGYHRNGSTGAEVPPTISALRVNGLNSSGNASDEKYIHTTVMGDLA